ncbi:Uu.00g018570.m01.CDS01 [Anthostomella pinea]|uniref:Uu.00g018570.m01.CDS01 n=1 Tax=Anthostomella pinea TaxID=933095 RepID=A0AAI8W0C0_9PEZI|nr:Uu.00g018570.m01.CDS01 [Anthostomella pinea]
MARRRDTLASIRTTSTRYTRQSADSHESRSTAPTSPSDSPRPSTKDSSSQAPPRFRQVHYGEDLSPSTSLYPRSSVETYSSQASIAELEELERMESVDYSEIPPMPVYRHEIEETDVRPSTPEDFARLFPTTSKFSIRHDDFTSDGNMNLRVDTVVSGRRKRTIQLFHLRMHDLSKREFSLRRYCRDSGREVCNSKRKYVEPTSPSRPHIHQSVSSAVKNLAGRPTLSRLPTAGSLLSAISRPGTSLSPVEADEFTGGFTHTSDVDNTPKARSLPTSAIKLEFSNYARVDIDRRGSKNAKRYEFEWWNSKYAWRRVVDQLTGAVSFHLLMDGNHRTPVAHIVPDTRSPDQVAADEHAGGWVPPCHMWFSDETLFDDDDDEVRFKTGFADVVVATGLLALVDDCIKQRWQQKKVRRISLPVLDGEFMGPRAFVQHLLQRRNSDHHSHSPLRYQRTAVAC